MAAPIRFDDAVKNGWRCDGCGELPALDGPLVQVGQEPDYDSRTAVLCFACLKLAMDVMTEPPALTKGKP